MIKQALLNYKNQSKKVYLNTKNFFKPEIFVKLADSKSEIKQAQKLRYQVFFSDRNKKKFLILVILEKTPINMIVIVIML